MKFLAWYTIVTIGLVQLFAIGEVIDGVEFASVGLFVVAWYTPVVVFCVKYLRGLK